jgi:hypothetical protein
MTEALAGKTCTLRRGEYLHSRASKLSSFTHRPQTGNWRRGAHHIGRAFGFAISATLAFLPNIRELTRV